MTAPKSLWLRFCRWGLAVLGISAVVSCEEIINNFTPAAEYGCPTMEYEIKGKVVNDKDGNGIEGLRVSVYEGEILDDYGSVLSGKDGEFLLSGNEFPQDSLKVYVRDIDGEENGLFLDTEQTVGLKQDEKGDGTWYKGRFSASDVIIRVKEAEVPAENE